MMFLDCPAYLDTPGGAVRCGLPAEVRCRFTMRSTDGPLESAMITCPAGHHFNGAIESLTWDGQDNHDSGTAGAGSRAGRGSFRRGQNGRNRDRELALPVLPSEPERTIRRPNTAPAYYLGRPAALWMSAMRPRRRPAASRYPTEAVSGGNPATSGRPGGQSAATASAVASPLRTAPSM
jgi:hypothetical protein